MLVARSRAEYYRTTILPLRRSILQETQKQYNAMLLGAFQLLAAKENQISAGGRYIEALREYWIARSELDELLGPTAADDGPRKRRATDDNGRPLRHPGRRVMDNSTISRRKLITTGAAALAGGTILLNGPKFARADDVPPVPPEQPRRRTGQRGAASRTRPW